MPAARTALLERPGVRPKSDTFLAREHSTHVSDFSRTRTTRTHPTRTLPGVWHQADISSSPPNTPAHTACKRREP